jgi:hypothetical protein
MASEAEPEIEQAEAVPVVEAQHDRAAILTMEDQRERLAQLVRGCQDPSELPNMYDNVHDGLKTVGATLDQQSALIAAMQTNPNINSTVELINSIFRSAENQKKHEVDSDESKAIAGDVQQGVQVDVKPEPPAMPEPEFVAPAPRRGAAAEQKDRKEAFETFKADLDQGEYWKDLSDPPRQKQESRQVRVLEQLGQRQA